MLRSSNYMDVLSERFHCCFLGFTAHLYWLWATPYLGGGMCSGFDRSKSCAAGFYTAISAWQVFQQLFALTWL